MSIIYEPRALWSVKYLQTRNDGAGNPIPIVERFPKEHFRNGWQHPLTLTHMLVAPIGYTLKEYGGSKGEPPQIDADRHDCAAAIQTCKIFVRSPGRQMFTLHNLLTGTFTPEPRADVSMRSSPYGDAYASSLLGISSWKFDKPLELPPDYTVDFRLGGALLQPSTVATGTIPPIVAASFYETGVGTDEPGSSFRSNVRSYRAPMLWRDASKGTFPFPADGLGAASPQFGWPRAWSWRFDTAEFRRQIASQAGPTYLNGFGVAIDQIAYDDEVQNTTVATSPIAQLSLRTPTYAKIVDAGSRAEWWRAGAPLALVSPSMTPAQVYQLAKPITLHRGDCLDLELEVPSPLLIVDDDNIRPTYQVGVSFTGYAAVEG